MFLFLSDSVLPLPPPACARTHIHAFLVPCVNCGAGIGSRTCAPIAGEQGTARAAPLRSTRPRSASCARAGGGTAEATTVALSAERDGTRYRRMAAAGALETIGGATPPSPLRLTSCPERAYNKLARLIRSFAPEAWRCW